MQVNFIAIFPLVPVLKTWTNGLETVDSSNKPMKLRNVGKHAMFESIAIKAGLLSIATEVGLLSQPHLAIRTCAYYCMFSKQN